MNDISIGWFAGFFEGEGTIAIAKMTKITTGHLRVSICNTEISLLEIYQERWAGKIHPVVALDPRRKDAWRWDVVANQGLAFLSDIEPYILSERNIKRIALAREYQEGARRGRHGSGMEYKGWRFGCYLRMAELNVRGRE